MLVQVKEFLKSKKASVKSFKIKERNKKEVTPTEFYALHISELGVMLSVPEFNSIIQAISNEKALNSVANPDDYIELIEQCHCVLNKYKWFRTDDSEIIFYVKTHPVAQEYKYLTTDFASHKFYTKLDEEEREELKKLIDIYNITYTSEDPTKRIKDETKFVNVIIKYMYKDFKYGFTQEPVTLSNDPNEYTFKFYDIYKLEQLGKEKEAKGIKPNTSAWDKFFSRIKDQNMVPLVKAFLAGIFIQKNKSKQVLYIYGEGNDGKTQVAKALLKEIGKQVSFSLPQNMKFTQFGAYSAYGKRFFMGDELRSENVFKTGMLHSLTGGSPIQIEKKNEDSFMTELFSVGIICSNYKPLIENVENQTSRIIYIEMNKASFEERSINGSSWSDELKEQTRAMICEGVKHFNDLNPAGTIYKIPDSQAEKVKTLFDSKTRDIESFVQEIFVPNTQGCVKDNLGRAFRYFCEAEIYKGEDNFSLPSEYRDNRVVTEIMCHLRTAFPNHQIEDVVKKIDGKVYRIITGIDIQDSPLLDNGLKDLLFVPKLKPRIA